MLSAPSALYAGVYCGPAVTTPSTVQAEQGARSIFDRQTCTMEKCKRSKMSIQSRSSTTPRPLPNGVARKEPRTHTATVVLRICTGVMLVLLKVKYARPAERGESDENYGGMSQYELMLSTGHFLRRRQMFHHADASVITHVSLQFVRIHKALPTLPLVLKSISSLQCIHDTITQLALLMNAAVRRE